MMFPLCPKKQVGSFLGQLSGSGAVCLVLLELGKELNLCLDALDRLASAVIAALVALWAGVDNLAVSLLPTPVSRLQDLPVAVLCCQT